MHLIGLGVSAAVFRDSRVLLVRRATGSYAGRWSLPGGKVELGETLGTAATRELLEETGLVGKPDGEPIVYEHPPNDEVNAHWVLIVFRFTADGEPTALEDAAEVRWVSGSELDGLMTTPGLADVVARLRPQSGAPVV